MPRKSRTTKITLYSGMDVTIYSGAKVQGALAEVMSDMTLYKGVRLSQLLEAVYNQGSKDGAKSAFEEISKGVSEAQKRIPHRAPGRPRKKG